MFFISDFIHQMYFKIRNEKRRLSDKTSIIPVFSKSNQKQQQQASHDNDKESVTNSVNEEPATDWRSIYVAAALSFVGSAQFSLYFSSLWSYLQILDKTATEQFLGFIVAIYSVGQIISSPIFGYWSNAIKQVRVPLYVGLFLMLLGNILYIALEIVAFPRRYLLFVGRFITGAGSGNVTLVRTYASTASTFKDRERAIAYVTCGQALGTTFGPVLQLIFIPLGYPGFRIFSFLTIDLYTAPAYLACAMNICGAIALKVLFKENYAGIIETSIASSKTASSSKLPPIIPAYDIIAVLICYFSRFTQMFINTNLETIGSAFSMLMFNFSEAKSVTFTSAAQGCVGIFTFATYFAYIKFDLKKYVSSRLAIVASLIILIAFHVITYSWPFIPGHVEMYNSTTSINGKIYGCNTDKFTWCQKLRPVNVYLYYTAYIIALGFAFPVLNITVATIFSKILGPRRQGTQQGIFQASGSAARTIGPIAVSMLYTKYGPQMAWNMEIVVISVTLLVWLIFYRRMVALKIQTPDPEICKILNANDETIISDFKPRTMTHKTLTSCKTIYC